VTESISIAPSFMQLSCADVNSAYAWKALSFYAVVWQTATLAGIELRQAKYCILRFSWS